VLVQGEASLIDNFYIFTTMNELFNFGKKKQQRQQQQQQQQQASQGVVKHNGTHFVFPNGSVATKLDLTLEQLNEIDWTSGKLSWLLNSYFKAITLFINRPREVVTRFQGEWDGGDFVGNKFVGTFIKGTFKGYFESSYKQWKPSPYNFIDGTVSDSEDGLLGVGKINPSVFDANSSNKGVSLLAIPIGYHVNISDINGMIHSFTMVKTLDSNDSNFILQSTTGSKNKAVISWSELRGGSKGEFTKNTTITAGQKINIPRVFEGDPIGVITYIEVSPKATVAAVNTSNPQNNVYKFNLEGLSPLQFNTGSRKPLITLKFDTEKEVTEFGNMNSEIKAGYFKYHLKRIINALQFDVVDGYGKNVYLQDMFGGVKGVKKAPADVQQSLDWLEKFMTLFIINIVSSKKVQGQYRDSPALQAKVMKQIALALIYYLPKQNPTQQASKKPTVKKAQANLTQKNGKTKFLKEAVSSRIFNKIFNKL